MQLFPMPRSQAGTSLTWCRRCTPILEEAQSGGSACAGGEDVNEVRLGTLAAGEHTAHVPAKYYTVHTGPGSSSPPGLPFLIWNKDFSFVNSCWTEVFFCLFLFFSGRAISPFFFFLLLSILYLGNPQESTWWGNKRWWDTDLERHVIHRKSSLRTK